MFVFSIHLPTNELCGTLGFGPIADLVRLTAAVLWQVVVTMIGLKKAQQLSWIKTLVIGLIGLSVYETVFWTYIR